MNHDERQMIADLFDRMRSLQGLDKDADAEAFIHQSMRENANSPYLLVQSVLAQEVALQSAGQRIEELEAQLSASVGAPRGNAGFAGSVPAGQPAPWEAPTANNTNTSNGTTHTSSPGAWGAPPSGASTAQAPASSSARSSGVPVTSRMASSSGRTSGSASMPQAGNQSNPAQAARSGGGFGQAMTTAAGVAGGMLLASSIGSLFGGGQSASAAPATAAAPTTTPEATPAADTTAADNAASEAHADPNADQGGFEDASYDNAADGGWGMDDFGGGDFEL